MGKIIKIKQKLCTNNMKVKQHCLNIEFRWVTVLLKKFNRSFIIGILKLSVTIEFRWLNKIFAKFNKSSAQIINELSSIV